MLSFWTNPENREVEYRDGDGAHTTVMHQANSIAGSSNTATALVYVGLIVQYIYCHWCQNYGKLRPDRDPKEILRK